MNLARALICLCRGRQLVTVQSQLLSDRFRGLPGVLKDHAGLILLGIREIQSLCHMFHVARQAALFFLNIGSARL